MDYEVEKLASENAVVGEGPVWHAERQVLYWIDIQGGRFWEFDPATGVNKQLHDGYNVAGVAPNASGGFAVGTWDGVQLWRSDDDWAWLHQGEYEGKPLKLNDVTTGPDGSLIGGTGHLDSCTLFRFTPDGSIEIIDDGLALCNGMGFSPDLRTFYSTDSPVREIYAWDHNPESGVISNKRVFTTIDDSLGIPDGMTVDGEGFVWSAIWYGGTIIRFDPDGKEERRVDIPAAQMCVHPYRLFCELCSPAEIEKIRVAIRIQNGTKLSSHRMIATAQVRDNDTDLRIRSGLKNCPAPLCTGINFVLFGG